MIRQAQPSDIRALLEIEKQSFDSDSFSFSQFKYLLTKAKSQVFIYLSNYKAVGYGILLTPQQPKPARIYSIAVSKSFRKQGIGEALLMHMIHVSKTHGYSRIYLEVNCESTSAIALYEKAGFVIQKTLPSYYENNKDGYKMTLTF